MDNQFIESILFLLCMYMAFALFISIMSAFERFMIFMDNHFDKLLKEASRIVREKGSR